MNELHGRIAESGASAADAEWLAAIRKWKASSQYCLSNLGDMERGDAWPHEPCLGCAPLRALLKRAMEREALP